MRSVIKTLSTAALVCSSLLSIAQKEGNNWYFGTFAGITFNTTPPSPLTDGSLNTSEGCSAISNKNGNLLFYTDGITVYNRNHTAMPNGTGLMAGGDPTQAALIVPKPGDTTHYYIFTADASDPNFIVGYRYSEVDMTLNGGLGDITANKNILLYAPNTERLTAVRHANGIDTWVLTKQLNSNRFQAFLVSCNGVASIPVISDVGIIQPNINGASAQGQMKVSPNTNKVCVASNQDQVVELFDFNNSTGVLSNPIDITAFPPNLVGVYGAEFSPNSQVLYVTYRNTNTIYQFDISSNNQAAINASAVAISSPYGPFALQLGPDQKIYIADRSWSHLSVIASPNNYGSGYGYLPGAVNLNGGICNFGLPSFISGYYQDNTSNWTADFTATFVNCSVQFSGSSSFSANAKWYWDFGDNTRDSGQTVLHSYRASGNYTVTLKAFVVTNCGNRIDSIIISKPVVINNVFAVDFNYGGNCSNDPYQLNDNTILTIGNITGWNWDFGDGNSSISQNPIHTFTAPGVYEVKFVVSTSGVCRADSIIKTVYVDSKATVDFSANNGCVNQSVNFNDLSVNGIGGIINWNWDFNDGFTSNSQNTSHTYNNPGNYNVVLTTNSLHGCSASLSKPVFIDSKPVVDFSANNGCVNQAIDFTDLSLNNVGGIVSWNWDFNDGFTSNSQNPVHTYVTAGNYTVNLVTNSLHGCSSSISKPLIIDSKPIVDFSVNNGCVNQTINFTDLSTNNIGGIVNWNWNFNDGFTSNSTSPAHIYITPGNYTVNLTANSLHGCSSSVSKALIVESKPVASFTFDNACMEPPVSFSDQSTISFGNITNWQWNFADNNTSNIQNPSHTYNQEGDYPIKLIVTSTDGCISDPQSIILNIRQVHADAGPDAVAIYNQPVQLQGSGGSSYLWSPGNFLNDPAISNPIATLADDQLFNLKVTAANSCIGFDDVKITVAKKVDIYVPTAFTPNNDGKNDFLNPICIGIKNIDFFTVYNRWGQMIFTTKDMNGKWDGTIDGVQQPTGAFIWMVRGTTLDGKVIEKKGSSILIR